MATISDQLAADIHNAFSKYYTDLANQDQIFFGAGNVTITKQDGTTATVASWAKVQADNTTAHAAAAKLATANTFTGVNTFTSTLNVSGDNAGIILTKNSDIGLVKKNGTFGKLMVGSGTAFSVVKSDKTTVSPTDAQTEIFQVSSTGKVTAYGDIVTPGAVKATGKLEGSSIELSMSTPYIDFHYGSSTADYTHRIIADDAVALGFECSIRVAKNIRAQEGIKADQYVRAASRAGLIAQYDADPAASDGQIRAAPIVCSQFATIGADGNGNAGGNFWFEELVGSHHRLVTQVKGYGAAVQYWHHRSDGQIWNSSRGDVAWAATSDYRLKRDIEHVSGIESVEKIRALELVKFVYRDDEQGRVRRGIIAQQAATVDAGYVKLSRGDIRHEAVLDDDGNELVPERVETIEKYVLDSNPLLMDAIGAVKCLAEQVERQEALIQGLQAIQSGSR